ncbi:MAG: 3,4-dihydroxy-2-butanone-4-phosphate synthase [Bradymonadaceae bacterium]|nr:3,4-dihydroxy-2-butanone-4-phosphate synthase [Lujinxingiaceae bacterium]
MNSEIIERVEQAIAAIGRGELVILIDAEERENEGDLVMAAERVTPEAINFMATYGRGLICMTMTGERIDKLGIPMMVDSNTSPFGTAFTVSIEAATGVTTGISAADRAHTIRVAVADETRPQDIVKPGHIFPLRARRGGVLVRTGQTEGSVDLARMAGLKPSGVICEIMNPDGTMARLPDLRAFAETHGLILLSVSDIITYRLQRETLIEVIEDAALPTEYPGSWRVQVIRSLVDDAQHLCFICGTPEPQTPTLVRVQPRCDTFDAFTRLSSPCTQQVGRTMAAIASEGTGVIVYLDKPETSALDLVRRHLNAPSSEDAAAARRALEINQPQQILRSLGIGAQILKNAGCGKIRVLTNEPKKIVGAEGYGIEIVDQVAIP